MEINMRYRLWDYIRKYKFKSIFSKATILIFCIVMLLVAVIVGSTRIRYQAKYNVEIERINTRAVERVAQYADIIVKSIHRQMRTLSQNNEVARFALSFDEKSKENYNLLSVKNYINTMKNSFDLIDSIYVYSEQSGYVMTTSSGGHIDGFYDNGWLDSYNANKQNGLWMEKRIGRTESFFWEKEILSFFQPVKIGDKISGVVIVNIDLDYMREDFISQLDNKGRVVFADNTDVLLKSGEWDIPDSELLYDIKLFLNEGGEKHTITMNGDKRMFFCIKSEYTGWAIAAEYSNFNVPQLLIFDTYVLIVGILGCFLVISLLIFAYKLMKQYLDILALLPAPELMDAEDSKHNETDFIMRNVAVNMEKSNSMKHLLEERLVKLRVAEFNALQAQINPHFIYNTLSGLYWFSLEKLGEDNSISKAIHVFAKMIGQTANNRSYFWTVRDEIEQLKSYFSIQSFRYGDEISADIDISVDILDSMVLKLILQPVVENSYVHGLKNISDGRIRLTGRLCGGDICFEVSDNGSGMADSEIKSINEAFRNAYEDIGGHGLKNVNSRIKLIYGDAYGVLLEREQGSVKTVLRLPVAADKSIIQKKNEDSDANTKN